MRAAQENRESAHRGQFGDDPGRRSTNHRGLAIPYYIMISGKMQAGKDEP